MKRVVTLFVAMRIFILVSGLYMTGRTWTLTAAVSAELARIVAHPD